jgi:hypothetical protein
VRSVGYHENLKKGNTRTGGNRNGKYASGKRRKGGIKGINKGTGLESMAFPCGLRKQKQKEPRDKQSRELVEMKMKVQWANNDNRTPGLPMVLN